MDSILNWYREEGIDLQGRLGRRRQPVAASAPACELLEGGGTASGPVSFMRGADASAGTIKSRRQDPPGRQDGHPRRRPPRRRGVHLVQGQGGAQGPGAARRRLRHGPRRRRLASRSSTRTPTTRCGSPTSSCRPSSDDADWDLRAVTTGEVVRPSGPATCCARSPQAVVGVRRSGPAVRHHDQPLAHRAATPAASTARNPCTEYMHLDNSACNLASLNLLKFLDDDDRFDVEGFQARRRGDVHRPGDPGRPRRLPDREDRRDHAARSASSASATPTSAPC